MTVDNFAEMVLDDLDPANLDNFQTTVCYPARRYLMLLVGVPGDFAKVEEAAISGARRSAQNDEPFLVAFRSSVDQIKIVESNETQMNSKVFTI